MLEGHIKELQSLLNQNPDLIKLSSPFAHGANLLYYLAANGVETHRQISSYNAANIVELLLIQGVNIDVTIKSMEDLVL